MADDSAFVDGECEHANSETTGDDRPKSPPTILTDAQWCNILATLGIESLGERERFDLASIISQFRYWAEQLRTTKADGRSPSQIRNKLSALGGLAKKLKGEIRAIKENEHARAAISAAMCIDESGPDKRMPTDPDELLLWKMGVSLKSLDDNRSFPACLDAVIDSVEVVHSLLSRSSEYVSPGTSGAPPLVERLVRSLDRWLLNSSGEHLVRSSDPQISGKRGGRARGHLAFIKQILVLAGLKANSGAIDIAIRAVQEARKEQAVEESS